MSDLGIEEMSDLYARFPVEALNRTCAQGYETPVSGDILKRGGLK